jgi:hypothetical protein
VDVRREGSALSLEGLLAGSAPKVSQRLVLEATAFCSRQFQVKPCHGAANGRDGINGERARMPWPAPFLSHRIQNKGWSPWCGRTGCLLARLPLFSLPTPTP